MVWRFIVMGCPVPFSSVVVAGGGGGADESFSSA